MEERDAKVMRTIGGVDKLAARVGAVSRRAATPVAIGIGAALVAFWRIPAAARERLWSEDGAIFLTDSLGGAHVLTPYDGYLHLGPRLLAALITTTVEVGSYDIAVTVASVGIVGLICGLTWTLADGLIESRWVRLLVSAAPALLPAATAETLGNLANLHTVGLWLAFWMMLHHPMSRTSAWVWGIVGLLVGLSEIAVVLLVPLMAVDVRDRRRWPLRAGLTAGVMAQFATLVAFPRPERGGTAQWSPADLVIGFAGQAGGSLWGETGELPARLVELFGVPGVLLLAIPPLVAFVVLIVRGHVRHRILAAGLVLTSGLLWSASIIVNFFHWMAFANWGPEEWRRVALLRYAASAGLFLFALVIVACGVARSGAGRKLGAVVAIGLILVAAVQARPGHVRRSEGEPWPTQAEFERRCADDTDRTIAVEITPRLDPPAWFAYVPCEAALSGWPLTG